MTIVDHSLDLVVESILTEEALKANVHAVAPIVARIGGDVDAFGLDIGETELVVDGEPILEGENGEE